MNRVRDAFDSTVREIARIEKTIKEIETLDKKRARYFVKHLEKYGYVISNGGYYVETLKKAM